MSIENGEIYPHCLTVTRTIKVGGLTKPQLIQKMIQHSICMNKLGKVLFGDDLFTVTAETYSLKTVELTIHDLGFAEGATAAQIFEKAKNLGLELCPLELGPYLRIECLDQPEGYTGRLSQQNQAPNGSITIASKPLKQNDNFPKGFYLRRIEGVLWLRGYVADDEHVWKPDDHFVFC